MNIYIANLSAAVNDGDLKELFQEYGEVSSSKVITDRDSGASRGFGFVEMPNAVDALKAIKELNEVEYDGKVIIVNEAKPKIERKDFNRERQGGGYRSRRY